MTIPTIAWLLLIGAAYLLGQYSQRHYDLRDPRNRATFYRTLAEGIEMHGGKGITTNALRMMADHEHKRKENAQ